METITAKVVNRAYAGEPEDIVLQDIQTNKIYEFSKILGENITDGDLYHPTILRILEGDHTVQITVDENDNVTLHF